MMGIRINSNKMSARILIFVFLIIPYLIYSLKKDASNITNQIQNSLENENIEKEKLSYPQQVIGKKYIRDQFQKMYSKYQTEIVDISNEKKLLNFEDGNKDILFVSTLDGYIHAIDSNNNELWKISLGKSLVNSHLNNYDITEQNSIIPDLDGNIYLYSLNNENKLKKLDIPLKTLIDNSPFTLPNIPNTIFLGDKKSTILTIDIEKGIILSKISSGENKGYLNQKPIQTNNLLTIIRTDFTLSSFNQISGTESWNVTISEIMAIQKGSKNELAVNWRKENSNDLMGKISKLLENPNLISIVSIHNYISDSNLPIKIYDNKKYFNPLKENNERGDFNFEMFFHNNKEKFFHPPPDFLKSIDENQKMSNNKDNFIQKFDKNPSYYNLFKDENSEQEYVSIDDRKIYNDYLNYTNYKMSKNPRFLPNSNIFRKLFFRFLELYYMDQNFTFYMKIFGIFLVLLICSGIFFVYIYNICLKKNKTKDKPKKNRKESMDNKIIIMNNIYLPNEHETQVCLYKTKNELTKEIGSNNKFDSLIDSEFSEYDLFGHNSDYTIKDKKAIDMYNDPEINQKNRSIQKFEKKLNEETQFILIGEDNKPNILISEQGSNKLFEQLYYIDSKENEMKNIVESDLSIYENNGKIIKVENKTHVTVFKANDLVMANLNILTNQMAPKKNLDKDEKKKDIPINLTNELKEYKANKFLSIKNQKIIDRKYSDQIGGNNTNNHDDFQDFSNRPKSIDYKNIINLKIKGSKINGVTKLTVENNTNLNSNEILLKNLSLKIHNNSNENDNNISTINISNQYDEKKNIENPIILKNDFSNFENSSKEIGEIKKNNEINYLNLNTLNKFFNELPEKTEKSKSRSKGNKSIVQKNYPREPEFTKIYKMPSEKNLPIEENKGEKLKKEYTSNKTKTNINLKRKYKEYNLLQDTNESNKLHKIDTTYIDEGRIGKNFEEFSKVGEGGFGSVFKAKHKIDGSFYALKVIKLEVELTQSLKDHKVIKEVKTMMKLYHKNVVRYYTCWFQLNLDGIILLSSENDHSLTPSITNTNSNIFMNTLTKKNLMHREKRNFDKISENSKNNNYDEEYIKYEHYKDKVTKKINLNDIKKKDWNNTKKIYESEKCESYNESSAYCEYNLNSGNDYVSKSLNRKNRNISINFISANKSNNRNIDLNTTRSMNLNHISESGESGINSKKESALGFNWDESNLISRREKSKENEKNHSKKTPKIRGRSNENSKLSSYSKIIKEDKNKRITSVLSNSNFVRKFSSLTDEINGNNNDKKAISISFEKNEETFSCSESQIDDDSHISYDENKNANHTQSKNLEYNKNLCNKNNKKQAQDDSVLDLTKRNKKRKKEIVYNVYFLVQMEFCDGLALNKYLEINKISGLTRQKIFCFFKQILSGVNQIHKNNIIHRDLKPHNIFILGENCLKIGDFGLAYDLDNYTRQKRATQNITSSNNKINNIINNNDASFIKINEFVGTPLYQSPEQIKELAYNEKVDIYAMGLILYEMCCCFKTGMERNINIEKLRNEHKINSFIEEKYPIESELILWMTNLRSIERPSTQEILNSNKFKIWKKNFVE